MDISLVVSSHLVYSAVSRSRVGFSVSGLTVCFCILAADAGSCSGRAAAGVHQLTGRTICFFLSLRMHDEPLPLQRQYQSNKDVYFIIHPS